MRGSLHFAFLSCLLLFWLALASSSSLNFCICSRFLSGNIKFHCFQQATVCQSLHFLVVFVSIGIFKLSPFLRMLFSLWHHQIPLVWTSIHFWLLVWLLAIKLHTCSSPTLFSSSNFVNSQEWPLSFLHALEILLICKNLLCACLLMSMLLQHCFLQLFFSFFVLQNYFLFLFFKFFF